jgi:hypothetical protein
MAAINKTIATTEEVNIIHLVTMEAQEVTDKKLNTITIKYLIEALGVEVVIISRNTTMQTTTTRLTASIKTINQLYTVLQEVAIDSRLIIRVEVTNTKSKSL